MARAVQLDFSSIGPDPHSPGGGRRSKSRRSGSPWFLRVLLLALGAGGAWYLGRAREAVRAAGFQMIETDRSRLDAGRTWRDGRWEAELSAHLAALAPFEADSAGAREALRAWLSELSFLAEVGEVEVLWPDGLRIAVRLRSPAAAVSCSGGYRLVASDGTLLSGLWTAPPAIGGRYLPVIGPLGPDFDRSIPGDQLRELHHRDALDVALSMWEHLGVEQFNRLGRIAIDASRGRSGSDREPGVRLLLEGGRRVWFGRSPATNEPGSVPVQIKWAGLSRALNLLDEVEADTGGQNDWSLLDLRWDVPDLYSLEQANELLSSEIGPEHSVGLIR